MSVRGDRRTFRNEDPIFKVTTNVDPTIWDESKYEAFVDELCGKQGDRVSMFRSPRKTRMVPREHVALVARCMLACVGVLAGMAGQVQAATYVVDQVAPGATDTNAGTEDKPFKTIQHAADAAKPGDTVCVMAGKYEERVRVKAGGAEGQPITFRAMPRRSATVSGFYLQAGYIRIEGFDITAARPAVAVQLGGSHCEVLDNYIHEMLMGVNGTNTLKDRL